jgi:hypothetical protein
MKSKKVEPELKPDKNVKFLSFKYNHSCSNADPNGEEEDEEDDQGEEEKELVGCSVQNDADTRKCVFIDQNSFTNQSLEFCIYYNKPPETNYTQQRLKGNYVYLIMQY